MSLTRILAKSNDGYPKQLDKENVIEDLLSLELKRDSQNVFPEDAVGDANLTSLVIFCGCRDKNCNLLEHATKPYKNIINQFDAFCREASLPNQHVSDIIQQEHNLVYDVLDERNRLNYDCRKIAMAKVVFKTLLSS